ncbi:MAG: TonB-dependent receptor [Gammaproteobacteria bacterium]|nr:TonB-dependent receptor [Gammaproteobacteria bacterium]
MSVVRRRLSLAIICGWVILPAYSQVLEEVVVTAQKRQQDSQDVGIAISAFTGDQLRALGVEQSFDAAAFSPGVHISGNLAGQNTQFTIRGVTQNDFNDVVEAPNAAYLDEGYLAVAQAQTFAVYDIERVEILKGPQGTLFGRNATGGLVHYISRKPGFDETSGYLDATYGLFDSNSDATQIKLEGALGGPLSDNVAARVAFLFNDQEGYLNNLYPAQAPAGLGGGSPGTGAGADMGDAETIAVRGTLDFQISEDTLLRVSANYAKSEVPTGPYQSKSTIAVVDANGELINVIDTPANETRLSIQGTGDAGGDAIDGDQLLPGAGIGLPGRSVPGGDFFGYVDPDGAGWDTSGDFAFANQGETETKGLNARLEWAFDNGMQLTSVTDWKSYDKLLFIDVDSAPINQLANYAGVDATSFTQEVRLQGETDRSRWVGGFYYLNIDTMSDNGLKAPENSIVGTFVTPVDIGVVADLKTDSYSLFGQIEYDFTDRLTGTFGLRAIREEKEFETGIGVYLSFDNFTVNQGDFLSNPFGAGSPFRESANTSDDLWAGKLQLDWRVSDDLLIYAGINRGVKAGSFNAPLLGAFLGSGGASGLPYGSEELLAFEAGFKSTFQNGRTRFNGSAFYYDYTDYQAFLFVGVGGVVINADAENVGVELELQSSPADGWDFLLSVAAFDATVKDILLRNGSPLPARDVDPTYAPEFQATGLARYEWDAFDGTMNARASVSYSDDFFYNLRNFDADKFDAYTMVHAGIGWLSSSERWAVNFDIRNLTDESAGIQGFDLAVLCGCNEVSYQPPRWYGLNVRWAF